MGRKDGHKYPQNPGDIKNIFNMKKYVFGILIIILFYIPCFISNEVLKQLTEEDGFYENLGALLFLATSITFFMLAINPAYYRAEADGQRNSARKYFWFLALLFLFAFGEEISWGQRIFNFETPEIIKKINIQDEFNLHNLEIFHGKTLEGQDKTGWSALFTMHRLFYIFLFIYLLVIPLLYKFSSKINSLISKLRIPVPNILFGVLFVFNMVFGNSLRAIQTTLEGHSVVEIKEVVIALIIFGLSLSWLNLRKS